MEIDWKGWMFKTIHLCRDSGHSDKALWSLVAQFFYDPCTTDFLEPALLYVLPQGTKDQALPHKQTETRPSCPAIALCEQGQ